jgi:cytochrome c-type biogenesis protein CcmH/NrfF
LVWILPVVAAAAAGAGLVVVFRRWSRDAGTASVSDADRDLVAEALRDRRDADAHGEGGSR